MIVSIIIPWSNINGEPYRQKAMDYVSTWWSTNFPDYELILCRNQGPFNRSASRNVGIESSQGDLLIIADADSVPTINGIKYGVQHVDQYAQWVVPYELYQNLSKEYTDYVYANNIQELNPTDEDCEHQIVSWAGALIAPREAVIQVGGYDERFVGWGHEDVAFRIKLDAEYGLHAKGKSERLRHLWHPIAKEDQFNSPDEIKNRILFDKEYKMRYNWRDERIS